MSLVAIQIKMVIGVKRMNPEKFISTKYISQVHPLSTKSWNGKPEMVPVV